MSRQVDNVCRGLEILIEEIKVAGELARLAGDRASERNLVECQAPIYENMLRNIRGHSMEYLKSSRFAKYFQNNEEIMGILHWEPIPDYGDKMTIDTFISHLSCGGIMSCDGSGNYATDTKMCDNKEVSFTPEQVRTDASVHPEFTHVIWFNK